MKITIVKVPLVLISVLSVWLYVCLTLELTRAVDIPTPILAIILGILMFGTYIFLVSRADPATRAILTSSEQPSTRILVITYVGTIVGVIAAFLASFATVSIIDPEYRREFGSYLTTCSRDDSNIKSIPVNKTVKLLDNSTMTVHAVTYNVPQSPEKPQEVNNWYCGKATLVEVTIDNQEKNDLELGAFDLKLTGEEARRPGKISEIRANRAADVYSDYLKTNKLDELRLSSVSSRPGVSRGWVIFSVTESSSNAPVTLLYSESEDTFGSLSLPK